MNKDIIVAIHEAELQASNILTEARAAAKESVAKAKVQAAQASEETLKSARGQVAQCMQAARQEGDGLVQGILAQNAKECEALKAAARKKRTQAQDYIIGRIVS